MITNRRAPREVLMDHPAGKPANGGQLTLAEQAFVRKLRLSRTRALFSLKFFRLVLLLFLISFGCREHFAPILSGFSAEYPQ